MTPAELAAEAVAANTPPVVLEARGLVRGFGDMLAVRDVSFAVRAGQIFGLVGPNGAGKTTTLKMLATLDPPGAGDAFVLGHSVAAEPEKARRFVGYMPDRGASFPHTTVLEHLDFFGRAFGLRGQARRDRITSLLQFLQLEALQDRLLDKLSKGMKQRVALARTLLNDPPVLLLDEPADGLDPRARIELRELLGILAREGKAIVISSHILTELSELCDACVIMEQGRTVATGAIGEILRPASEQRAWLDIRLRIAGRFDAGAAGKRCERALLEQAGVTDVSVSADDMRFRLEGDEQRAAAVLRALVSDGLPVCAFEIHAPNLEDAFMQVTRGNVQ
jgi:ABC-2 type transport system ATP-binding protein